MDIRRGIMAATEAVLAHLRSTARTIQSKDEIQQVATISANGDIPIGQLIANAMEKVGRTGTPTHDDRDSHMHD